MSGARAEEDFHLTDEQVLKFHEQGFLGPFELMSPDEMAEVREHIDEELLTSDGPISVSDVQSDDPQDARVRDRNRDCAVIADLCMDPRITHRMTSIYGPDLLLLYQRFWNKEPGDNEVPWHQDDSYFALHPSITVTAWVAIDEATTENGCIQIVPGTHTEDVPHVEATNPEEKVFDTEADPEYVDESEIVEMELEPGEFFLFTGRTLHHSPANTSDKRRMGMSVRATAPFAYLDPEKALKPDPKLMVMHGEDYQGLNNITAPPEECKHD